MNLERKRIPTSLQLAQTCSVGKVYKGVCAGIKRWHRYANTQSSATYLRQLGYNLESGPPIEGYAMPDGQIIIIDGHHRLAALELLGETNIPIRIHPQLADEGLRKMLKIGEYSGFYPPSKYPTNFKLPDFGSSLNHEIDNEASKFVQENL